MESNIQINPITPQTVPVYDPSGNYLAHVNVFEWNDLRIQCRTKRIGGYYAMYAGHRIEIDQLGRVSKQPKGFLDLIGNQMTQLF